MTGAGGGSSTETDLDELVLGHEPDRIGLEVGQHEADRPSIATRSRRAQYTYRGRIVGQLVQRLHRVVQLLELGERLRVVLRRGRTRSGQLRPV